MKTGKTLQELAAEIDRQAKSKRDFVASTAVIKVNAVEGGVQFEIGNRGEFPISEIAHDQIADHTGIPKKYYDRMRSEAPDLLANNVNRWFNKYPAVRMSRTLDNRLRAFLS